MNSQQPGDQDDAGGHLRSEPTEVAMPSLPERPEPPPPDVVHRAMYRLLGNLDVLDTAADGDARTLPSGKPAVTQAPAEWPGVAHGGAAMDEARYVFGEPFAAGGLGIIRRAEDRRLGRTVAVKELLRNDDAAVRRFALEARVTARLQHPGVVPLYDIGCHPNGDPYYCMKFVEGRTLEQAIHKCADLPGRLALLEHVIATADTIAYAHRNQILHRDLKPANILIGEFGETVVIDWGLAKDLTGQISDLTGQRVSGEPGVDSRMTRDGTILGTLRYMPPEQARGDAVDARSDVFSLGAVLFHLIAGAAPYAGVDPRIVVARVLEVAVEDLRVLVLDAPVELVAITRRAMAANPADRYASAEAFAQDLRQFLAGRLVGAHRYSAGEVLRRWLRRHRAITTVAGVALAVLTTGGLVAVQNIRHTRDLAEDQRDAAEVARAEAARRADEALVAHAQNSLATDLPAVARALSRLTGEDGKVWRTADQLAEAAAARGLPAGVRRAGDAALHELHPVAGQGLLARDELGRVWRWNGTEVQATQVAGIDGVVRLAVAAAAPVWIAVGPRVHVFRGASEPVVIDSAPLGALEEFEWHITPDGRTLAALGSGISRVPVGNDAGYIWDLDEPARAPVPLGLSRNAIVGMGVSFTPDLGRVAIATQAGVHVLYRNEGRREIVAVDPDLRLRGIIGDHLVFRRVQDGAWADSELVDVRTRVSRRLAAFEVHPLSDDDIAVIADDVGQHVMTRRSLSTDAVRWTLRAPKLSQLQIDPTGTRFLVRVSDRWAVGDLATGTISHYLEFSGPMWQDDDTVIYTAGAVVHSWQRSAAPLAIVHQGHECTLAPDGRTAVLAPSKPEDGLQRIDLASGDVHPLGCPRPLPLQRFKGADAVAIKVAADDLGRAFAVGADWNCWSDGAKSIEITSEDVHGPFVVALPGGGFITHGLLGDLFDEPRKWRVQLWQDPRVAAATWTLNEWTWQVEPNATGEHIAARGNEALHVLHRAGGVEVLPLSGLAAFAWANSGATLTALRSDGDDLELSVWDVAEEGATVRERHRLVDTPSTESPFLVFTPSGDGVALSDRAGSMMLLHLSDGVVQRVAVPMPLVGGRFLAEDQLLGVDMEATLVMIDFTGPGALPLLATSGGNSELLNITFAQAAPGAPLWICDAMASGALVRWSSVVPDAPTDMLAWLRTRSGD